MEQETEEETVYFVSAPFGETEEEIVSNYIVETSDGEVIMVQQDDIIEEEIEEEEEHEDIQDQMIQQETSAVGKNPILIKATRDPTAPENEDITEKENDQVVRKTGPSLEFPCAFCDKSFRTKTSRQRHATRIHGTTTQRRCDIRCIECSSNFKKMDDLRFHLQEKHKLDMSGQKLSFPNLEAFKKWKRNTERQDLTWYTLKHGGRMTSSGRKWLYICHRSGRYECKIKGKERKRILKPSGSCKLGLTCTSTMEIAEKDNEVRLTYFPHHYGHGKKTSFVHLSIEERAAIQENVSAGIPFEDILEEIREGQSTTDSFQIQLIKKKDINFINKALAAEDYFSTQSDADSVDQWVRLCCRMEESPILFYRREETAEYEEEFLLIIMTEFQKQILLSAQKQIVCIDSCYRRKGGRFYLTYMTVIDDLDNAFPVAFCISNRTDKAVMSQFVSSIRDAAGLLEFEYFMSDSENFYYESWKEEMHDDDIKWLWGTWYVDSRVRTQFRIFKGNILKRHEVYKTMRVLMECQNINVFQSVYKNYINTLNADSTCKSIAQFIEQKFYADASKWAYCYRKDIKTSSSLQLEIMHRTFRYLSREGRKIRMDKFIFVMMKLVRYKMLDRLANMLDDEKTKLAVEAISMFHAMGMEIPTDQISCISEKIWLIKSPEDEEEEEIFVTKMFDACPELCSLKCTECDSCVHMYSCSCVHSMINANLCQHIHAVVYKFLTPHFSPPASPTMDMSFDETFDDLASVASSVPKTTSQFFESVLKRTHEAYTKIRASKCSLDKDSLSLLMTKMNECIEICSLKTEKPLPVDPPMTPLPGNKVYILNPSPAISNEKLSLSAQKQLAHLPKILPKPAGLNLAPMPIQTIGGGQGLPLPGQKFMVLIPGTPNQLTKTLLTPKVEK